VFASSACPSCDSDDLDQDISMLPAAGAARPSACENGGECGVCGACDPSMIRS
jgi:hypothetical protein